MTSDFEGEYGYLWGDRKTSYVLIPDDGGGYSILGKNQHFLLIEDEAIRQAVAKRMFEAGVQVARIVGGKLVDAASGKPIAVG